MSLEFEARLDFFGQFATILPDPRTGKLFPKKSFAWIEVHGFFWLFFAWTWGGLSCKLQELIMRFGRWFFNRPGKVSCAWSFGKSELCFLLRDSFFQRVCAKKDHSNNQSTNDLSPVGLSIPAKAFLCIKLHQIVCWIGYWWDGNIDMSTMEMEI